MQRLILIAAAAGLLATFPAAAAPSQCKGLDQSHCAADQACAWRPALVKGETAKSGKVIARNVKAHCRLKSTRKPA